jgi:hypothetical protein
VRTDPLHADASVIEVRVFSGDRLVALEHCTDEAEVDEVRGRWAEVAGVTFLVDEVSSSAFSGAGWE